MWSEEKAKIYLSQLAPGTYRPFIPTLKAINPVQGTEIKITEEDAITGKIHSMKFIDSMSGETTKEFTFPKK